ncbi:ABC transporter permease [Actinomadura barringtoniae]|uniref:ABC transporter permease n=1 Tax=Actinomadura barringtoniae TaxID=1427535 RepID=A0A939PCL4_9ACTN|nr:ABC transporter permease [Actinomadura barringtoniae]MBO2449747.1 ABC transporter permease [Actinomadura barringtoniae]
MRRTGRLAVLWRGIRLRRGMSAGVFLMAVVSAAAASVGPSFHDAAATSALRQAIALAPPGGQSLLITLTASTNEPGGPLSPESLQTAANTAMGANTRLFRAPVREIQLPGAVPGSDTAGLMWRDGVCGHLTLAAGRCPQRGNEVVVDEATATARGWRTGSTIPTLIPEPEEEPGAGQGMLTLDVAGVYTITSPGEPYWYGHAAGPDGRPASGAIFAADPLITSLTTYPVLPDKVGLIGRVMLPVRGDALRSGDGPVLGQAVRDVAAWVAHDSNRRAFSSTIVTTLDDIDSSLGALQVPVVTVTVQLVVLCWLLLFFLMIDIAEARAPDVALAKLRGLTGVRLLVFGLAEPLVLLAVALPVGVLAGRFGARLLADTFVGGVPMGFPSTVWPAAAATTAGGAVAAALAFRAALTRPVTEQWRRTAGRRPPRGWIPEAVLLTLVAGGLVQIIGNGPLGDAGRQHSAALLVPGLLALGAALVAARLLPPACRSLFARTRRRGGLEYFLALRHIARRPGVNRITISLATSVALVVFAVAAWSVTRTNHHEYARLQLGAPVAFSVSEPPGQSVADFAEAADPGGRDVAGVMIARSAEAGTPATLAVDPQRFARVAYWRKDFAPQSLAAMTAALKQSSPPPVALHGDRLRIRVRVQKLNARGIELHADLIVPGQPRPTEVGLGTLPTSGRRSPTTRLPGCERGCEIQRIFLRDQPAVTPVDTDGQFTVEALDERVGGRWRPVDAGLAQPSRWRIVQPQNAQYGVGNAGGGAQADGLHVTVQSDLASWRGVYPATFPETLSAIVTPAAVRPPPDRPDERPPPIRGLNAGTLAIRQAFTARALPAVADLGVIVDQDEARRSAGGIDRGVEYQVWTTPRAAPAVRAKIRAAGMTIFSERSVGQATRDLDRQGPGLALALLLAASAAAALLAAAGAMLSLYASGRRRTYELAALRVAGTRRRVLAASLVLEQLVVLGFGALVGVGAGLLTIWLALPSVPQFVRKPTAPVLTNAPDPLPLGLAVTGVVVVMTAGSLLMSRAIMSRVHADQLREAPP